MDLFFLETKIGNLNGQKIGEGMDHIGVNGGKLRAGSIFTDSDSAQQFFAKCEWMNQAKALRLQQAQRILSVQRPLGIKPHILPCQNCLRFSRVLRGWRRARIHWSALRWLEEVTSERKVEGIGPNGELMVQVRERIGLEDPGANARLLCAICLSEFAVPEGLPVDFI